MVNNAYDGLFESAGQEYNVDPRLLKTIFHIESSGNPGTKNSSAGAQGGMQLMPDTAAYLGVSDPKDMTQAIPGAARYVAEGLEKTGSPEGALSYYFAGPDQSGWGPKTAAYVAKGKSLYPQMTVASSAPAPSAAPTSASDAVDPAFAARWGIGAPAANNNSPPAVSEGDFASHWGIPTAPAAPAPAAVTPPAAPTPAAPAPAPTPPVSTADKYAGWDVPGAAPPAPASAPPNALSYQGISSALAPAPNTTYGSILPFAIDNATGARRFALPTSLRDLAQGAVDLAQGPTTGTVTPKATMALATIAPSLMPSPAAGTSAAIGAASGATDVPSSMFDRSNVAKAAQIRDIATQNQLQTDAPLSPAFKANPGVTAPQTVTTAGAADTNPLAVATPQRAGNPLSTNAAEPAPAPTQAPVAPATAQEAKEYAAIPEKLPPAPIVPPLNEAAAGNRADQLIQHFSTRGGQGANDDLVPGYAPTLAQKYNDPGLATLERGMQSVNPGPFAMRAEGNQQAIGNFVHTLTGAPEDIAAAEEAREASTGGLRDAAFANKTAVDAQPISDGIDQVLAGPDGKRAAISKTLTDVQKSLHIGGDTSAPLETDPEMLYGVRKHINDLLSPVAQRDNPELQAASSQLIGVKNGLDDAIESGAPGFKNYVNEYAAQSQPIDAMKFLQSANLTDASGNVTLQKVDGLLKTIQKQQGAPGVQKASAVTDDQMAQLNTLRNTLRAQAASNSGKALGSNTFQNLATNSRVAGVAGNPLVALGMTGAGAWAGGPLGALAGAGVRMAGAHVTHNAEDMVQRAMIERLLNLSGRGDAAFGPARASGYQNPLAAAAP